VEICRGAVTGRILDRGRPVAGASVYAYGGGGTGGATTGADGRYLVDRLVTGTFVLEITLPGGLLEYHPGVADPADAVRVTVRTQQTTNAGDTRVVAHGSIGGQVLTDTGVPAARVFLVAYEAVTNANYITSTDEQGRYELPYVYPGRYRVSFQSGLAGYGALQWAEGRFMRDEATLFTVRAGHRTVVADRLLTNGRLVVEYRRSDGTPVADAWLQPELRDGTATLLFTDANGHAEGFVAPGTWKLRYQLPDGGGERWWPNATDKADAAPIDVRSGAATTVTIQP
jgi:hypothetical protein